MANINNPILGSQIAAGSDHSLAIAQDGSLWAWGNNNHGQVGDGTREDKLTPTLIKTGEDKKWKSIAAGSNHSLAIAQDGSLWVWGRNDHGELGDGTQQDKITPVEIGKDKKWQSVAAGDRHSLAIAQDGGLWAWGNNYYGQLGDGTKQDRNTPIEIGKDKKWKSIAVGVNRSLAIAEDDSLWAWGTNSFGELGDGTYFRKKYKPVEIGKEKKWQSVAAGNYHSLAIAQDDSLWVWGRNDHGELGDGTQQDKTTPVEIGKDKKWQSVAAGNYHSLAIAQDGGLWAWGRGDDGRLGDGKTKDKKIPIQIGTGKDWQSVAAGDRYSLAIAQDGGLWAWGINYYGQLGDGKTKDKNTPIQIDKDKKWAINPQVQQTAFSLSRIPGPQIAAGSKHSLAIAQDGTLWAWGSNSMGQLGDAKISNYQKSPFWIGRDKKWQSVAADTNHSFAIAQDGTLWAWGSNFKGQLGNGRYQDENTPFWIGRDKKWQSIATNPYRSFAIAQDGSLWAWGSNDTGQLGDGEKQDRSTPFQIGTDKKWQSIAAGIGHSLAIAQDGSLWAWGSNYAGQLGDGEKQDRSTPFQIGADKKWQSIAAGRFHSLAIAQDGSLWAWGSNKEGQLGDGTYQGKHGKSTPIQIGRHKKWKSVTANSEHSLAIAQDGSLWAWGSNKEGQLGDGTYQGKNTPTWIGHHKKWKSITTGEKHSLAIAQDGSLWAWGANDVAGQLGDGTYQGKNTPIQIDKDKKWKADTRVSFYNQMNLVLKAYRLVNGKRDFIGEIDPHDAFTCYSYKGVEWEFTAKFGDEETGPVHRTMIYDAGTYNLNGNLLGQAISQETKKRKVILTNNSPFEVSIQEKKTDGSLAAVRGTVAREDKLELDVKVGTTLEAKDKYSGHRIAQLVVPHGDGAFTYNIQLKSWSSKHASTLTIYNRTNILLDVYWLDYEGKEQKITEIAPGGAGRLQTYLTHPWVIKDQRSGRIIERIYGKMQDEVVEINSFGIVPKEGQPEVDITFTNKLPFAVDLYKVTATHKEEFLASLNPDETFPDPKRGQKYLLENATPVRIREFQSQAEVELYVPSQAPQQHVDIQLKTPKSARATTVEIVNLSLFNLKLFTFDENGKESSRSLKNINSRESFTISNAKVGQPFFLQEEKSGKVVGYFVGTVNPLRYEFSGLNLRSVHSEQTNKVTFRNVSKFGLDVYWMTGEGIEEFKEYLEPKKTKKDGDKESVVIASYQIEKARIGHIYVFRDHHAQTLLHEVIITSSRDYQTIDVDPQIISKTDRHTGQLWPGEVALFTEPNYKGSAYVFHKDVYDPLDEINDKIHSIKLGPGTALTAFEKEAYGGKNDVFYMDTPDLAETNVEYGMSSFQISTISPELTSGISAISRLTQEPEIIEKGGKKELSYQSVFRTTLKFPASVSAVEIFSSEETTFKVGKKPFTRDPLIPARITVGSTNQVVLTTYLCSDTKNRKKGDSTNQGVLTPPATKLRAPILMLRTNTMSQNERFFVFQDVDLHKKLAKLEPGALVKNKQKLGINPNYTDDQLQGVQAAIQNLANSIPAVHATKAHGQTKDLYVASNGMQYKTWGVNFKNGETADNNEPVFRSLSSEEIKAATREGDPGVKRSNLDVNEYGQWNNPLREVAKKATNFVVEPVKVVKREVEEAAGAASDKVAKGVSKIAKTAKDTGQVLATTGVQAVNSTVKSAEDALEKGSEGLEAVAKLPSKAIDIGEGFAEKAFALGETVFKATLDLGDEIVEFTIDTVDKVVDCIEMIVEKVVESVEKVIAFLQDAFVWEDIIDTHNLLVSYFNDSMDGVRTKVIPKMETELDNFLTSIETKVLGFLDEMMDEYGTGANQHKEEESSILDEAMDQLGWIIDQIFGDDEEIKESPESDASADSASDDSESVLEQLKKLGEKLEELAGQYGEDVVNAFTDGIEILASAVTAGKDAVKRIIGGLLSIVKALVTAGFGIVRALSAILIDLFKVVITLFQKACNTAIEVPVISDLYKFITKSDLTILSVTSLLVAAPVTIICKMVTGKSPKEMTSPASTSISRGWSQFLSIAYGCTHLVLAAVDTLNDQVAANSEFKLLKNANSRPINIQNGSTGQQAVHHARPPGTPVFSIKEPSHIVPIMVNILGFFTQGFGLPLIPDKKDTGTGAKAAGKTEKKGSADTDTGTNAAIKPEKKGTDANGAAAVENKFNASFENAKDGLSFSVWLYQWLYSAVGLADWAVDKWGPEPVKNIVGPGAKFVTTGLGVVHLGANIGQVVLDVIDTSSGGTEKAKLAARSTASLISTLPSIGKVLFLSQINVPLNRVPSFIGSGLNATGHFVEGGIFIARGIYADV